MRRRALRMGRFFGVLACALWLSGCVSTRTSTSPAVPPDQLKDLMTASDEPDAVKRGRARMDLAAAYFGRGQMTTALDQIKLSIQADPTSSEAFNLRGLIYANLGDAALAEDSFRHALQINPLDADTMQNFGWYLCQLKRYPEADGLFNKALGVANYRNAPRTWLTKGLCQANAGDLANADASLSRSYELDPNNPSTAFNLAEVLYRRGEFERARFDIRQVNKLPNVSNAQSLWLAVRIENRLGNRQGVKELGTQLRNRFPESREASSFDQGVFDE